MKTKIQIGDNLTLKDGTKCQFAQFPETRPNRRKLGWAVKYWDSDIGTTITRVITPDEIAVNHSRPEYDL